MSRLAELQNPTLNSFKECFVSQSKIKALRKQQLLKPGDDIVTRATLSGTSTTNQAAVSETINAAASIHGPTEKGPLPNILTVHEIGQTVTKPKVYWTELAMPYHNGFSHRAMIQVAMAATRPGYAYMPIPYRLTDLARNTACSMFIQWTDDPEAVLIMLDSDHIHPPDVVPHLASYPPELGVVGALAFKRDGAPLPCWFKKNSDGVLVYQEGWEQMHGIVQCDIVGTGAIAIKRWVFDKLEEKGYPFPYFRIPYFAHFAGRENIANPNPWPGEDVYFGISCIESGIPHYVDLDYCTPHLVEGRTVDRAVYEHWAKTGVVVYNQPKTTVDDVEGVKSEDATPVPGSNSV